MRSLCLERWKEHTLREDGAWSVAAAEEAEADAEEVDVAVEERDEDMADWKERRSFASCSCVDWWSLEIFGLDAMPLNRAEHDGGCAGAPEHCRRARGHTSPASLCSLSSPPPSTRCSTPWPSTRQGHIIFPQTTTSSSSSTRTALPETATTTL